MALHTGEPAGGAGEYVGVDVHRTARICTAGHGGQILLSWTTYDLVMNNLPNGLRARSLGDHRLKDLARPMHLYQIVAADLPADFPPLKSLDVLPNNLPVQLTSFIGREQEMAEVKRLLSSSRLLTLTGIGGVGKTRLALQVTAEVLDQFKDGVWLVELASLTDPDLLPQAVAFALGVREQAGRPLLAPLAEHLQSKEMLLVLDNCEHLLEACALLVHDLLLSSPGLRILVTSRQTMDIPGETTWQVPPLSSPDPTPLPDLLRLREFEAVRLFADRAAALVRDFLITKQTAPAVAEVCHRLDGIPLAIELAAARVKVLSVTEIARRLDDRFQLLTGGSRTALPRHQTLRAAMEWSYELLPARERTLFARLTVFAGGWTMEAAEAICAGGGIEGEDVFELLAQLVDKSLVVVDQLNTDVRHRMLETVRQYGHEKLREMDEDAEVRKRHRDWYLALAERAESTTLGHEEQWLDHLEAEHDNFRAALESYTRNGTSHEGLRLAGSLRQFWLVRGYWTEGRQWLETLLATGGGAAPVRAKALSASATLAQAQGDYERAVALGQESLAIEQSLGDRRGIADCLRILGNVMFERGNFREARALHEESRAYGHEAGDRYAIASALVNLANVTAHEGDYARAMALCEESLVLFRALEDKRGTAFALYMLGILVIDQGDYTAARTRVEESLAIRRELRDKRGVASSLSSLALVAREQGRYEEARALYDESLAIQRELGDKRGIASSLRNLGLVLARQGDNVRAVTLIEESLLMRQAQGNKSGVADSLEGLALVAQEPERVVRFLGAATALREAVGAALRPSDRAEYDRRFTAVRANLGEAGFTAAWDQGRAMTLEQAIRYAVKADTPSSPDPPAV